MNVTGFFLKKAIHFSFFQSIKYRLEEKTPSLIFNNENMIDKAILFDNFQYTFEDELIQEISENGTYRKVEHGTELIDIGEYITRMPLLISGSLKVMREDKDGNEIFLYYLERGDTCAFALTCCMNKQKSEIRAICEEECEIVMLEVSFMERWLQKYPSWRAFVFLSYNTRLNEMLETIDSIAFMRMDERLLKYLTDKVKVTGSTIVSNTHQDIARELNTSRVVISRLLKQLERQGTVKIKRNQVEVLNF